MLAYRAVSLCLVAALAGLPLAPVEHVHRTEVQYKVVRVFTSAYVKSHWLEVAVDLLREVEHPLLKQAFPTTKRVITHRFTLASPDQVSEIAELPKVNVSFADPDNQRYVSVSGVAQVVRDREKFEELWRPEFKIWFPEGKDDPEIALLRVSLEKAEYWDSPSSTIGYALSFVSSLVTGKQPDLGENKKVDLS